jgi:hypothetical protein
MMWVENQTFRGEDIKLDFTRWRKCDFMESNIIVKYGEYDLVDCDFTRCKLTLAGNAISIMRICKLFFPQIPIIGEDGRPQ